MFVLGSFGDPLVQLLGSREQFWAAYISAATFSSFGAICLDLVMKRLRGFPMAAGVGASGTLMAVVVAYSLVRLDTRLSIIFLPWLDFSAAELVPAIVMFDIVGLALG